MKVLLFDNVSEVDKEQLQHEITLLPEWRRERVMDYCFMVDRILCTKAYLLLKEGLYKEYGIQENPKFAYNINGKPSLCDYPNIHFNISHCKKAILCVIDDNEVGCDIEVIPDSLDESLCDYCFNYNEKRQIENSDEPCIEFARLWTIKEAFLKYTGDGISDNLKYTLSDARLLEIDVKTYVDVERGFVYTLCNKKEKI